LFYRRYCEQFHLVSVANVNTILFCRDVGEKEKKVLLTFVRGWVTRLLMSGTEANFIKLFVDVIDILSPPLCHPFIIFMN
jgi:hypothetical protein